MHLSPVVVRFGVSLDRVVGKEFIPLIVGKVFIRVVELLLLSVEAFVVLRISVGANPDIIAGIFVGSSFPVHLDLLELFEGLVVPGIKGLLISPVLLGPFVVSGGFIESKASFTSEGCHLVLSRAEHKHVEVVLIIGRN